MYLKSSALVICVAFATSALALADPSAAPSGPPASDAVSKLIAAQYALTCTAVLDPSDKNLDASFATLAPDFVSIDPKGTQQKRDDVIANAKQQLKTFHGTDCNNSYDSMISTDASTVVAVDNSKITGDIQAPDGKHDLEVTSKSQDTWKLEGGTWLETQSKDLHVVVKIDGNVVQDSGGS